MTLLNAIEKLNEIALEQPNIRTIITNDVYKLDAMGDVKYNVFCITQNQHMENVDEGFVYYSLNLFFIDRLTDDYANELEIQSTAIQVLRNIIYTFINSYNADIYNYTINYTTFEQQFADLCAGAYATLSIAVPTPSDECYEQY